MLEVFRNAAKGWAAKVLIGLLVVSFGVWGISDVFTGATRGALATVGDQEISSQEYTEAFRQAQQNYSRQTGQNLTPETARLLGVDRQILGDLLNGAALDEQARELGLVISDGEIARQIANNPNYLDSQGKFDAAAFRDVLERNGLNEPLFIALERRRLLRGALTGGAEAQFAPPDALVEAVYRHQNEQRDAKYFTVTAAESEIAAPTDSEIKDFYEKNPRTYTAPEYRSIAILKIEPEDIASAQAIDEAGLKAGYDRYKQDYFTPETRTIQQITFPSLEEARKAKERIAAGEDFLAVATERGLGEADATLATDARMDSLIDPVIADAAFKLVEGAVSDPVEGRLSIALLRVTAVAPEHQKTLEEVKPELTTRLQLEEAREEIQSVYDAVEDARAQQTPFEEIAKASRIPFTLVAAVDDKGLAPDGTPVELPHKNEVLRAAFASDPGVENDALTFGDGYVWHEVRATTPSAVKPLDGVKDQVRADLVARKLRDLAQDKAAKLAERGRSGTPIETLAQEAGAAVKTVQGLKRNESSAEFDPQAIAALFAIPENGFAVSAEPGGKGARVMQSQAVTLPPFDPKSTQAEQIRRALTERTSEDVVSSYLAALQQQAGVTLNEDLWRQIAGLPTP